MNNRQVAQSQDISTDGISSPPLQRHHTWSREPIAVQSFDSDLMSRADDASERAAQIRTGQSPVTHTDVPEPLRNPADIIHSLHQSKGEPLAESLRERMEHRLGTAFTDVQIHTDVQADQFAQDIHAKAFTYGQDIFFRSGEFDPYSVSGQDLIAHELAHTIQQRNGRKQIQRAVVDQRQLYIKEFHKEAIEIDKWAKIISQKGEKGLSQRERKTIFNLISKISNEFQDKQLEELKTQVAKPTKEDYKALYDEIAKVRAILAKNPPPAELEFT
jgi:hypothetical protein